MRANFRIAMLASALIGVVACADVYSTDLDIPPNASNPTTIDAGHTTSTGLARPQPPPVCPDVNPMFEDAGTDAGSGCELGGAICEYGTSSDRNCNQVFACSGSFEEWRQLPSERCIADQCPKNQPISVLDGVPCTLDGGTNDSDETHCNMSDGVCACTTGRGGSDVHARRWVCTKPLASCPLVRPNEGQPCEDGMLCDYGSCRSKRGMAMTCISGVWGATTLDCSL